MQNCTNPVLLYLIFLNSWGSWISPLSLGEFQGSINPELPHSKGNHLPNPHPKKTHLYFLIFKIIAISSHIIFFLIKIEFKYVISH